MGSMVSKPLEDRRLASQEPRSYNAHRVQPRKPLRLPDVACPIHRQFFSMTDKIGGLRAQSRSIIK
jgi:hypothetical protein